MVHEQVPAVGLMSATGDLGALEEQMANDHAVAVDLMNRYSSQSSDNQRMMNYWTQPPTVVVEAVAPASSPSGARVGDALGAGAVAAAGRRAVPVPLESAQGSTRPRPAAGTARPAARRPEPHPSGAGGRHPLRSRGAEPRMRSAAPAAIPGPYAAGPGRGPGTGNRRTGRSPATAGSATGRAGPGVVGAARRPPLPDCPQETPGARGLPSAESRGGVRPIVPGPPAQAGATTDWRTGLRTAPGEPPARLPRTRRSRGRARTQARGSVRRRRAGGRGPHGSGHGILPMSGAARPVDQEHRRPGYLLDDTDAFADDRWFPPPVIGGDVQASRA